MHCLLLGAGTSTLECLKTLIKLNKDVSFVELESKCGHDAFLLEFEKQTKIIKSFLRG